MNDYRDTTLDEIRAIKEACWQEVAHLPIREALAERLRIAARNADSARATYRLPSESPSAAESVREDSPKYRPPTPN